ncbi:MAG: glycosyltransferase family 2 protein [Vicinamibacteria bacterium]|nr:glycosyltransferase family 2 protein [Vicinamibacteria bacterium]
MTRLVIVIVSFNAREDLARALASLHAAPPATPHEIVVVDNASTDGAPAMVRERFPAVRVIDAGGNNGFARANNIGIRASSSELVLLLNPDTVVPSGAIDAMVARIDQMAGVAALGPRLVDAEGRAELSFGAAYSPWSEARRKIALALDARAFGPTRRWVDRATRQAHVVDWVSGACLLVRRAAGDAAGWLDERYFMYAEDVDFCAALRQTGGQVLFSPVAEIVHLRGRSGRTTHGPTRDAWRASHLAYYRKHLPRWAGLLNWYLRHTD